MKFLGKKVSKRSKWCKESLTWIEYPSYILCPTDNADEQMLCLKYEVGDITTWQCKHCECGRSDHCDLRT